jgi:hypothetical protein
MIVPHEVNMRKILTLKRRPAAQRTEFNQDSKPPSNRFTEFSSRRLIIGVPHVEPAVRSKRY